MYTNQNSAWPSLGRETMAPDNLVNTDRGDIMTVDSMRRFPGGGAARNISFRILNTSSG